MISSNCKAFPNKPSQCRSMAKVFQSINLLPICQSVTNPTPIHNQYIWPLYVYTRNKISTGTHHWSRRRTISLAKPSVTKPGIMHQSTNSSLFLLSDVYLPFPVPIHQSSTNSPIHHQYNPNTGQYKWQMCQYTGNKNSTLTHHWSCQ